MFDFGELRSLVHGEPSRAQFLVLIRELLAMQDEHTLALMLHYAAPILHERWPSELLKFDEETQWDGIAYVMLAQRPQLLRLVHSLVINPTKHDLWVLDVLLHSPHLEHLEMLSLAGGVSDERLKAIASSPHLYGLKQLELYNEYPILSDTFTADGLRSLFRSPNLSSLTRFKVALESSLENLELIFFEQPRWPSLHEFELRLHVGDTSDVLYAELMEAVAPCAVTSLTLWGQGASLFLEGPAFSQLRSLSLDLDDVMSIQVLSSQPYTQLQHLSIALSEPAILSPLAALDALPALESLDVEVYCAKVEDAQALTPCLCEGFERVTSLSAGEIIPDWFWENVWLGALNELTVYTSQGLLPLCDALRRCAPAQLQKIHLCDSVISVEELDELFRVELPAVEWFGLSSINLSGALTRPLDTAAWPKLSRVELRLVSAPHDDWRALLHSPWMQHVTCLYLGCCWVSPHVAVDSAALFDDIHSSPYLKRLEHVVFDGFYPALSPILWRSHHWETTPMLGYSQVECGGYEKVIIGAELVLSLLEDERLYTLFNGNLQYYTPLSPEDIELHCSPSSLKLYELEISVAVVEALVSAGYFESLQALDLGGALIDEQAWAALMRVDLSSLRRLRVRPDSAQQCSELRSLNCWGSLHTLDVRFNWNSFECVRELWALPALKSVPWVNCAQLAPDLRLSFYMTGQEFVEILEQRLLELKSEARG